MIMKRVLARSVKRKIPEKQNSQTMCVKIWAAIPSFGVFFFWIAAPKRLTRGRYFGLMGGQAAGESAFGCDVPWFFFSKGVCHFFLQIKYFFGDFFWGGGMGGWGCGTRWPSAYEDTSSQVYGHLVPYPRSHISKWRLVKKKYMSILYIVKSISYMKIIVIAQEGGGGRDGRPPTKIHPPRRTT